jgi:hypothetical protein
MFEAGPGLGVIACRRAPREWTVGVTNNSWKQAPLRIVSHAGPIASVRELPIDSSERGAPGHLPSAVRSAAIGANTESTISGGDIRIFRVTLEDETAVEIPHRVPPPAPAGRILNLCHPVSLKRALLERPTFLQHYDGLMLDWRYLAERDKAALESEGAWLKRQSVRVVVDLTSGLNLYPDLRLLDNIDTDYESSMSTIVDVMGKMAALHSRDLVLSLHRSPENNFTTEQTQASFETTLRRLAAMAAVQSITLHLRVGSGKPPASAREALKLLQTIGAANVKLALNPLEPAPVDAEHIGLWTAAAPSRDISGEIWTRSTPIAGVPLDNVRKALASAPAVPLVFDAVYSSQDDEYRDARAIERTPVN